jgi:hypothetical protein
MRLFNKSLGESIVWAMAVCIGKDMEDVAIGRRGEMCRITFVIARAMPPCAINTHGGQETWKHFHWQDLSLLLLLLLFLNKFRNSLRLVIFIFPNLRSSRGEMDQGETKPNQTKKTKTYQRISSEKNKTFPFSLSLFFCFAEHFEAILLILFRISLFFPYSSSFFVLLLTHYPGSLPFPLALPNIGIENSKS